MKKLVVINSRFIQILSIDDRTADDDQIISNSIQIKFKSDSDAANLVQRNYCVADIDFDSRL